MKRLLTSLALTLVLTLLLSCGPSVANPVSTSLQDSILPPEMSTTPAVAKLSGAHLILNPVETEKPIYGSTLLTGYQIPWTFDAHQKANWGPTGTLQTFNQLVMFDINYKETVPETLIGDLAESWETNQDGTEITFKLRQGVKWHDGASFTADDVIYSLDKMTDPRVSAISGWFPAYQNTEKIDDYTVTVHLKYASASFMMALAQGESQIQSYHLSGVDPQSAAFMVGTGPFILTEYLPGVHLKWKRNPDYFKKDKYGNQLPYLDGIIYYHAGAQTIHDMLISRRIDIQNATTGPATLDAYNYLKNGAPELLWQKRDKNVGDIMVLNLNHKPLDDIRVRRAMGLVLNEDDLIVGYSGDVSFGIPGQGLLPPSFGLPKEEVAKLMGWDKPYEDRVTEAQRLMAEAGYPDGFELNVLSGASGVGTITGSALVFAQALRQYLKIDVKMGAGFTSIEIQKRLKEDNYDLYPTFIDTGFDPVGISRYFGTGGYANTSNYSNPELDKILSDLDHIIDPDKRREAMWAIERILLTDLPALPTGCFVSNFMPYYPWVKNLRFTYMSYSNINRLEDVWIDESLRVK